MQPVTAAAGVVVSAPAAAAAAAAAAIEDETIFATAQILPVVRDEELGAVGGEGVYPHGVAVASTTATYQVLLSKAVLLSKQQKQNIVHAK